MAIEGISRIDTTGLPAATGTKLALRGERFSRGREPVRLPVSRAGQAAGRLTQQAAADAAEPIVMAQARAESPVAQDETYVRIRFDEGSHRYLIQVLNATNDEVLREFPPEAWSSLGGSIPLPKGMLVEKER